MAEHRHKRDTEARRKPTPLAVIGPLAVLATAGVVSLGVAVADPAASDRTDLGAVGSSAVAATSPLAVASAPSERPEVVTRAEDRTKATPMPMPPRVMSKAAIAKALRGADQRLWTTEDLNIWSGPGESAENLGVIEAGEKVLVTGRSFWGRTEIALDGKSRWVTSGYLSDEEPTTLGGECTNGTSVASGVVASIVAVHEAVCSNFPEISVYGTLRGGGGDHSLGKAVDIMVSGERGWQVAEFVRENAAALGVSYVIYAQQIWSVERSGEGWRGMSNRGSDTANHYDHVHVSVF